MNDEKKQSLVRTILIYIPDLIFSSCLASDIIELIKQAYLT